MASKSEEAIRWLLSNLDIFQTLPAAIGYLSEEKQHNSDKQSPQADTQHNNARSNAAGIERYEEENRWLQERNNALEQQLEKEKSFREKRDVKFRELFNEKIAEVDAYKSRLAAVSEKRVQLDQRKVENTLSRNRQSEVERCYQEFYDGKRVDAVEKLEEQHYINRQRSFTSVDKQLRCQRLACKIFEIAYETAVRVKETFIQHSVTLVDSLPKQAIKMGLDGVNNKFHGGKKIPFEVPTSKRVSESTQRDLVDILMLSLKEDTEPSDLKELFKAVTSSVKARYKEDKNKFLHCFDGAFTSTVKEYIRCAARLSWFIVTQMPPLVLEYKQPTYDPKLHVVNHDRIQYSTAHVVSRSSSQDVGIRSNNGTANSVYCYLWPALLDADGRVIMKGEILLSV